MSKHPGLADAIRAAGNVVSYPAAYARLEHGWPLDRAVSTPPHRRAPNKEPRRIRLPHSSLLPWERAGYVRTPVKVKVKPRRNNHRIAEDTSPRAIQLIRKRYCDEFIATGRLDEALGAKLREYADACRKTADNSHRVSSDHAPQDNGQPEALLRVDGVRDNRQAVNPPAE